MQQLALEPKVRMRKWGLRVALVLFVGILAVAAYQGPLWMELSFAAKESFPTDKNWQSAHLRADVAQNLRQYSPQRLAQNLRIPSEKWRGVVCLALCDHPEKFPDRWAGVPDSLMKTLATCNNEELKRLLNRAFLAAPAYTVSDVESTFAALEQGEPTDTEAIVEAMAQRAADQSLIQSAMLRWLESDAGDRRRTAFQILVRYFPQTDEATASKVKTIFSGVAEDLPWEPLHLLISRRSQLGQTLLAGDSVDHLILFRAMRTNLSAADEHPRLLAAVQELAAKELAAADDEMAGNLVDLLIGAPGGLRVLFDAIPQRNNAFAALVFERLPRARAAAADPNLVALSEQNADTFMRSLQRLSGRTRRRWAEWFIAAGNQETAKLFPASAGPNSPKYRDVLTPLLGNDNEAGWVQWYFERVAPFPAEQAPTVVAMLRRSLTRPRRAEGDDRGGGVAAARVVATFAPAAPRREVSPSLPTEQHLRYAVDLQRRFPNLDQVKAFFREYPTIAERVRREIENDAKKPPTKQASS